VTCVLASPKTTLLASCCTNTALWLWKWSSRKSCLIFRVLVQLWNRQTDGLIIAPVSMGQKEWTVDAWDYLRNCLVKCNKK
jgi:hypothetical protein